MEFLVAHHLLLGKCHYMVGVQLEAKILLNICLLRFHRQHLETEILCIML
jgi:hypothetical protein